MAAAPVPAFEDALALVAVVDAGAAPPYTAVHFVFLMRARNLWPTNKGDKKDEKVCGNFFILQICL